MELADPERALALAYAPAGRRAALAALWALDERLAAARLAAREPMLRAIRLAWWREALERLDGAAPPDEPLLRAVAAVLLPAGVRGAELAALEEGWAALANDEPDEDALRLHARARGGALFALSATLLGGAPDAAIRAAGEGWALIHIVPTLDAPMQATARTLARARLAEAPRRWPRALRSLGVLTVLARRDAASTRLRRPGAPARVLRALAMGIGGR